jgi:uncharacterized membrane protein YoaK (UPF0700 family)
MMPGVADDEQDHPGEATRRFGMPPLAATVALAAIAGYVDAFSYVHLFGVFPANQSGNAVLAGIAIGEVEPSQALLAVAALIGFGLGVALGLVIDERDRRSAPERPRAVLVIELALLAALTVVIGVVGGGSLPFDGAVAVALLVPTAFAMGVQTPVITSTRGVPTPTTYMTGTVTHLAEAFTEASVGRDAATSRQQRRRGVILATALGGYVGGAAIGAAVGAAWHLALVVPTVALAILVALHRRP